MNGWVGGRAQVAARWPALLIKAEGRGAAGRTFLGGDVRRACKERASPSPSPRCAPTLTRQQGRKEGKGRPPCPRPLTSARVGVGSSCMDCSSWEATMTGLPAWRQRSTISFCTLGTSSRGIWAPAGRGIPGNSEESCQDTQQVATGTQTTRQITSQPAKHAQRRALPSSPEVRLKHDPVC